MLMSLLRAIALAFLASVLSAVAIAAGSDRYRLAGVLAVGPDFLGILELPGGDQMLVRKGSVVEGVGRVVLLDATRLRVAFPGRPPLEISLDGSDAPAVVPPGLGVIQDQIDRDDVMIRSVDSDAMLAAVERSQATPAKPSGSAAATTGRDPAAEAGRRLAPILNLPPNSRVVAINEQPVRSADQALKLIEQSLERGESPRLNLSGTDGESRVYVSPAPPEP